MIKMRKRRLILYGSIVAILAILSFYFVVPAAMSFYDNPLGAYAPKYLFTSRLEAMKSTEENFNYMGDRLNTNSTTLIFNNSQTINYVYLLDDLPQVGGIYKVYLCWDTTNNALDYRLVKEEY